MMVRESRVDVRQGHGDDPGMTASGRFRIAENVAWTGSVEGQSPAGEADVPPEARTEAWVALVPDGQAQSLNGSGLAIWLAVAEAPNGATLDEVVQRVRELTGVADVPSVDVADFLKTLVGHGLVTADSSTDSAQPVQKGAHTV